LIKLAIILIRLISRTWRIWVANPPSPNAVIAFWHGEMLPVWRFFAFKNASAVVSQSKDGEILSSLLKKWKYKLYRGSSSKGGSVILNKICTEFDNDYLLITPDGPRGPAKKFKAGAAVICQRKQIPLVLCSVKIHSKNQFNKSWDSFQFPLPFSKIDITFSDKINIPREATREDITQLINEFEGRM